MDKMDRSSLETGSRLHVITDFKTKIVKLQSGSLAGWWCPGRNMGIMGVGSAGLAWSGLLRADRCDVENWLQT